MHKRIIKLGLVYCKKYEALYWKHKSLIGLVDALNACDGMLVFFVPLCWGTKDAAAKTEEAQDK